MKKIIKQATRELRKKQTESEQVFWDIVRNRKFLGLKFLRQRPIIFECNNQKRFFIADFYCAEKRIILEIDGKIHADQKEYDELRTYIINILGKKVIRIKNEELKDIDKLKEKLVRILQ
jgi:very-short-patch-repair endonuclease